MTEDGGDPGGNFKRVRAGKPDPRRAYRVEETPPELASLIVAALDRIIAGSDETDGTGSPPKRR
jgi:hypothetical protein